MSLTIELSPQIEEAVRAEASVEGVDETEIVRRLLERVYGKASGDAPVTTTPRPFGLCRGEFAVPDDFDSPLPDSILDSFEGE